MKIVAGLGNPGPRYRNTRHNAGFVAVDRAAEKAGLEFGREKYNAVVAEGAWKSERLLLLKPLTFMNLSGGSVARAVGYNSVELADLLVVVDDVNLGLGRIRLRAGGSAGGHNGLKSVIERLGTDQFARLRIGVGESGGRILREHVLSSFAPEEKDLFSEAVSRAAEAVLVFVEMGIEKAMNDFNNGRGVAPD